MSDWTLTIGDGPWSVETCSCGFGGGDKSENFPTLDDALAYARHMDDNSDASVRAVRGPDGEVPNMFDRLGLFVG